MDPCGTPDKTGSGVEEEHLRQPVGNDRRGMTQTNSAENQRHQHQTRRKGAYGGAPCRKP